ncbi:hypothetical protein [Novosphingobium sp. KN65.2]|uniref:hypothetical protein n=1 Tax=Novosphingobium sp. KN65.2 TaxID=1478134 RepID=UPI0005E0D554|nr:hypothetical protein [Novosphingobium sp. KN65.2]CDO34089.1 hypothetical protein SPHV1_1030002 [Novosphingobium sp. KN65.2]
MTDKLNAETLRDRVNQFQRIELPGQPMMMHMGTNYLVRDLWAAVSDLLSTNEQMAERVAELEADAARYRWLRDHSVPPHNFYISVPDEFHGVKYSPSEVDAYIDEARAAFGDNDA